MYLFYYEEKEIHCQGKKQEYGFLSRREGDMYALQPAPYPHRTLKLCHSSASTPLKASCQMAGAWRLRLILLALSGDLCYHSHAWSGRARRISTGGRQSQNEHGRFALPGISLAARKIRMLPNQRLPARHAERKTGAISACLWRDGCHSAAMAAGERYARRKGFYSDDESTG